MEGGLSNRWEYLTGDCDPHEVDRSDHQLFSIGDNVIVVIGGKPNVKQKTR